MITTDEIAESQVPLAEQNDTQPVVATLFIANYKSSNAQKVHGASGHKYTFKFSPAQGKLVREYSSLETFRREELDIRKNRMPVFAVCTLIGSLNAAENAHEALSTLIEARLKVPLDTRREALLQVVKRCQSELAVMNGDAPEPPETALEPTTEPPEPINPEPPQAKLPPLDHNHEDLMTMPFQRLKSYAAKRGIHGGNRVELVDKIIATAPDVKEAIAGKKDVWSEGIPSAFLGG